MIRYLKSVIAETNPVRLLYHKMRAVAAAIYYGFPSRYLNVIAVTGTKGKTTVSNLITSVLNEAGYKVGMASTILFQVGDRRWANTTKITTLGPFFLQKLLREMVNEKCTHAVIEVTSHALLQNRIWGINVDTAILTNVGEDHLEYHGGFENYLRTKGMLFAKLNRSARKPRIPKVSIINRDDANFAYFDQFLADKKYTYGFENGTCFASDMTSTAKGASFVLHVPNNKIEVNLGMPGQFNVYNALAAGTVALANNISLTVVKEALEKASTIPGRLEAIDCGQKYSIIVDFAHTEDSLEQLLSLYKTLTKEKLYVVFGATGGGRDKGKRPKMGKVADNYADVVILTDDDPYEEDEWKIIENIAAGINRKEGDNFWKIPHREEAIKLALTMAKEGDTVVLAGKGAEEVMMIGGKKIEWDDRKIVRSLLSREMRVEIKPGKTELKENVYSKSK
jgi:UDP-N-acetylmuramoyl-L-alanyl-D-glutamate--2,6-diaminopimelate ligase